MNTNIKIKCVLFSIILSFGALGCINASSHKNGKAQHFPVPEVEAKWIRQGEALVFEGKNWYPIEDFEVLTDSEVYQIGEFNGVQIFVDKLDIEPFNRIYTKLGKNKFRYFEQRADD